MAAAILYCTFVLLLYLQGNYAQQGLTNNQNIGVNNAIGFQQQALQRTNTPNNINQIPNGGLNINLPQQSNLQQGIFQQPIGANLQGNLQQSLSLQANSQPQGGPGSLANMQFIQPGLSQLSPGLVTNPSKSQIGSTQLNNDCRQNAQIVQQQNNMGPNSNVPTSQTQNAPYLSNSLAELAALKSHPSLLSLFSSQNNAQPQQNQQMANFNSAQNQLADFQKQFLVRAVQSQSSGQNQPSVNFAPTQLRVGGADNRPTITVQGLPVSTQQSQAIVAPIASQSPYIAVHAQPLTTYLPSQLPQVVEEPSMLSLILSELQPSDSQYNIYPPYPIQKRESKSNLRSLIPLIINLLKEKSSCGCRNCGCQTNGSDNINISEPTIFSGYSNLKNYGQETKETSTKGTNVEETKSKSNTKARKNDKKNAVESEEASEENDSEYDSEED